MERSDPGNPIGNAGVVSGLAGEPVRPAAPVNEPDPERVGRFLADVLAWLESREADRVSNEGGSHEEER